MIIDAAIFQKNKNYLLSYKIQKTAGILNNIGGHSNSATENYFMLDGVKAANSYAASTPLSDNTNIHEIKFNFTYSKDPEDYSDSIFIQPNRWNSTSVTVNVTELKLVELYTTKKYKCNQQYDSLPTPSKSGYTFKGWWTAASGGTQISSTTRISCNQSNKANNIYAHWTKN